MKATYYIATDDDCLAIYGIGLTAEEAATDARTESKDPESEYVTIAATERLYRKVEADGGAPTTLWQIVDRHDPESGDYVPASSNRALADLRPEEDAAAGQTHPNLRETGIGAPGATDAGDLYDDQSGAWLRAATAAEVAASSAAADSDGGRGVIEIDGARVYAIA